MNWQERPFIEYMNAVDNLIEARYGITSDDTSIDMIASAHENGEAPEEIVEQLAEKYDLDLIGDKL